MWKNEYLQGNFSKSFSVSLRSTFPGGGNTQIVIEESTLRSRIVGSHQSGICRVSYPKGYSSQARNLAYLINRGLQATESDTGVRIPFTVHFILMPQREKPGSIAVDYRCDVNEAVFPLFFTREHRSSKAILSNLLVGLDAFLHEVYEFLLVVPQYSPTVLPDAEGQVYGLGYRSKNYTRWFRDGFATYAAYVTIENIWRQSPGGWPRGTSATGMISFHRPLSALEKVRRKLLRWDQYDGEAKNDDYYNASFGAFLAMEHRWKRAGIRRLMKSISTLDYPDGEAVLETCNQVLEVDFAAWLDDFRLDAPDIRLLPIEGNAGLRVAELPREPMGSGLSSPMRPGDILVQVDDTPIGNLLDYELALLRRPRGTLSSTPLRIQQPES